MALSLMDRCDKHQAAAAETRWETNIAGVAVDLMFCGHCTRARGADLLAKGFRITEANADLTAVALAGATS